MATLTRSLIDWLKVTPPRLYTRLTHYVAFLTEQRDQILQRYPMAGYETAGMVLLEKILGDADISTIRTVSDPFDRYEDMVLPIVSSLNRIFDITVHEQVTGSFIQHNAVPGASEYLLPCEPIDPYASYPLGKGWDAWKHYRPLRLLYVESDELSFHAYLDVLVYRHDPPPLSAFSLDCAALVLQYATYLDMCDAGGLERLPVADYLHRFVIFPCLINDALTLWILRHYQRLITTPDTEIVQTMDTSWVVSSNARMGSTGPAAFRDAKELIDLVRDGNISPQIALSSLVLPDGASVASYILNINAEVSFPVERQYLWAEYLRDEVWLFTAIPLIAQYKNQTQVHKIVTYLKRDFGLTRMTRFWTSLHNTALSQHIQNGLAQLMDVLDGV